MDGNMADKTPLKGFLPKIEKTVKRQTTETPMHYPVDTPRGRLTQREESFLTKPWDQVRAQPSGETGRTDERVTRVGGARLLQKALADGR